MSPERRHRPRALCTVTLLALTTLGAVTSVTAQMRGMVIPGGEQTFALTGTCAMEVTPATAVIVGGVAAGALKPVEGIAQLEQHLGAMRAYVTEAHGQLLLLERVRTAKSPGPRDKEQPFQVVQRLRAEFAADAPVDTILERLIELGLDRFGDNVVSDGSRRGTVIRYRIEEFNEKMREFQQRCTAAAWREWCATPIAAGVCPADEPPANLQLQSFSVRSRERLLQPDGGIGNWNFNYSVGQRFGEPPELLGNVTVHLSGTIMLLYRRDEKP